MHNLNGPSAHYSSAAFVHPSLMLSPSCSWMVGNSCSSCWCCNSCRSNTSTTRRRSLTSATTKGRPSLSSHGFTRYRAAPSPGSCAVSSRPHRPLPPSPPHRGLKRRIHQRAEISTDPVISPYTHPSSDLYSTPIPLLSVKVSMLPYDPVFVYLSRVRGESEGPPIR